MLKYVLVLALIGMCLGADDDTCPSGKTDEETSAACKTEYEAMLAAALAKDAEVTADFAAMSTMDEPGSGCA